MVEYYLILSVHSKEPNKHKFVGLVMDKNMIVPCIGRIPAVYDSWM